MLSRVAERTMAFVANKGHFLRIVFLYLAIVFVIRVVLFPGASEDDAEQLIYAQAWSWGYKANQPPLYTWLVILSQAAFGASVFAVELVKFSCLFMLYGFLTSAAYLILKDRRLSALCGLSLVGIYHIGWDLILNYSHSALMAASVAASIWALFRLLESPTRVGYIILGIAVGVGLLAKYNFVFVLVPMVIAALSTAELRRRLLSPAIFLSLIVMLVIISPHYYWFLSDPAGAQSAQLNSQAMDPMATWFSDVTQGLSAGVRAFFGFLMPFGLIAALMFWRPVWKPGPMSGTVGVANRFLSIYFLSFIGLVILGILTFRLADFQNHWMMVLIPAPLYLMVRLQPGKVTSHRLNGYGLVLSLLAVIVIVGISVRYTTGPAKCRKCNFFIPYAELAAELKSVGFEKGTMITIDYPNQIGGNLKRYFPDARITGPRYGTFVPPKKVASGACYFVWNAEFGLEAGSWPSSRDFAARHFAMKPDKTWPVKTVEAEIKGANGRKARLAYVVVPDADKAACN